MARLEELTLGASVKGILPDNLVTVVAVKWIGTVALELTYKDAAGKLGNELIYRDREPKLEIAVAGRPWSFDGDGDVELVEQGLDQRQRAQIDDFLGARSAMPGERHGSSG